MKSGAFSLPWNPAIGHAVGPVAPLSWFGPQRLEVHHGRGGTQDEAKPVDGCNWSVDGLASRSDRCSRGFGPLGSHVDSFSSVSSTIMVMRRVDRTQKQPLIATAVDRSNTRNT